MKERNNTKEDKKEQKNVYMYLYKLKVDIQQYHHVGYVYHF